MEDKHTDGPDQAQKVRDGREDIAERQAFPGQSGLHGLGSDLAAEFQSTMRPEKVVSGELIF